MIRAILIRPITTNAIHPMDKTWSILCDPMEYLRILG